MTAGSQKLTPRQWLLLGGIGLILIVPLAALSSWVYSKHCLLYTSPSPRDLSTSRMPSSA